MTTSNLLTINKVDRLTDTSTLIDWAKRQELTPETFNGVDTHRYEKWWGYQAKFENSSVSVFETDCIESEPLLVELRDRYHKTADSVLLYYYPPGTGIGDHRDAKVFDWTVTIINLIDDATDLFGEKPWTRFRFNGQLYMLADGDVFNFDSEQLHGVPPVKSDRYSLSFRRKK